MTIPKNVQEALDRMCTPLDKSRLSGVTAECDARCMELIRAHLLSQDAEIASLENAWNKQVAHSSALSQSVQDAQQSLSETRLRLAEANALLRESLKWILKYPEAGTWGATTLCRKLQSHLQGDGDEA